MDKLNGQTKNITDDNIAQLKQLFPDIFHEGKINFDHLQEILGHYVNDAEEHYKFTWHGKRIAGRLAQSPSTGTLRPAASESVNFDSTKNIFIEGDNLEVLKLLQKSYHRKIKMIYIDPPYNTGNDFVYTDNFTDNLKNYLEQTGQTNEDGKKTTTNSESSGRYHTNWLNMIYPRLKLARNLLSDDGVIFISIDDNEQANLRKVCDEVFGEENFVNTITWESKTKSQNTKDAYRKLQPKTEFILVYFKNNKLSFNLILKGEKEYPLSDDKGLYRERVVEEMAATGVRGRDTMIFEIEGVLPKNGNQWKVGTETIKEFKERNDLEIRNGKVILKMRKEDERNEIYEPFWGFFSKEFGTAETAKKELKKLMNADTFDTVKPINFIKRLCFHSTAPNDIVLDFFAGSGTTAHAVMQLNAEDGGNRQFICVQIPEPTDEKSEAFKAGYKNIAEISKERIRRAGAKIKLDSATSPATACRVVQNDELSCDVQNDEDFVQNEESRHPARSRRVYGDNKVDSATSPATACRVVQNDELSCDVQNDGKAEFTGDVGFKVFKLDTSNLKRWDATFETIETDLINAVDYIKPDRTHDDLLYELLIKFGLDLSVAIEKRIFTGVDIYIIGLGALVVCLDENISLDLVDYIGKLKAEFTPETSMRVVFHDHSFLDDSVKTNTMQILKRYGIEDVKSL